MGLVHFYAAEQPRSGFCARKGCLGGEARKRRSYVGEGDVVDVDLHSSSQCITVPRLIWSKKLPEESSVD